MTARDIILHLAVRSSICLVGLGVTSGISAQDLHLDLSGDAGDAALTQDDDAFEVGGSCAALAYLSSAQLKSYINAGYSDDFHSFCYPEEPQSCADYSTFLKGLGRLSTGEDGYHCSLSLQSP
jgi:hypothetical protein